MQAGMKLCLHNSLSLKQGGRNVSILLVINFIMTDSSSVKPEQYLAEGAEES